jgi:predicted TIM-barrel fold metal-dependent hydrolase
MLVNSDVIEQVWLMDIPYYRDSGLRDLASAQEILEVSQRYPGFFIPFGFIDFTRGPDQVDAMKEKGFVGLKAIRPPHPYDDPAYFPIYERAARLRMPVLFHVGIILKNTREEMTPSQTLGPTNMRPSMLDAIAAAFPGLPLIQGHMGFPWINELFEALYYYPHIYCSLCGFIDYRWLIDHLDRRCAAGADPVETLCDRMLFATDVTYGRPGVVQQSERFARFIEGFFDYTGRSYLWGLKKEAVMGATARKLMADIA